MWTTTRPVSAVILAAVLVSALGCRRVGSSDAVDGGDDAGVSYDGGQTDDDDLPCSLTMGHTCVPLPPSQLTVDLDVQELAAGGTWRFVDIGGYHGVLAERDRGDGPEPVVVFPHPDWDGGILLGMIAVLPDDIEETIQPIAITNPLPAWDVGDVDWLYAVLARTPSGYTVYGVADGDPWGDIPDDYEDPTGFGVVPMKPKLAIPDSEDHELRGIGCGLVDLWYEYLCVYGDGVRCSEGSDWSYAVAAGTGLLNGMTFEQIGDAWGLVVGDDGRMVRLLDSGWQVVPTGADDDLRVVFGTSAGYYAAGENGVYATLPNTDPPPETADATHLASAEIVDLFWPLPFDPEAEGGIELSGLTANGCAFDLKGTEIISCYEVGALDGPVLGSTYWAVPMVSSGRFFLTEDTLFRFTIDAE